MVFFIKSWGVAWIEYTETKILDVHVSHHVLFVFLNLWNWKVPCNCHIFYAKINSETRLSKTTFQKICILTKRPCNFSAKYQKPDLKNNNSYIWVLLYFSFFHIVILSYELIEWSNLILPYITEWVNKVLEC